jgi:hypothetical protein
MDKKMDLSREIWGFMSDLTDRYRIQWIFQEHLQETMFFFMFFSCAFIKGFPVNFSDHAMLQCGEERQLAKKTYVVCIWLVVRGP